VYCFVVMNKRKPSQSRISIRGQNTTVNTAESADWHPADIKASLEKHGLTHSGLSRNHGYHSSAAGIAIRSGWPEMERLIAKKLGVSPATIWPSRYNNEGYPLKYAIPRRRRT
jgi:Ner family transcriptional regulator